MNVRQAILAAAYFIRSTPGKYWFSEGRVPSDCGAPGCALGWIGFFAQSGSGESANWVAKEVLGCPDPVKPNTGHFTTPEGEFYLRMNALEGASGWTSCAETCAATLRKYADLYHPEKKERKGIPSEIRAIFDVERDTQLTGVS